MSFQDIFPFSWEEELNFTRNIRKAVHISNIPPQNAFPAFKLESFFRKDESNKNRKRTPDTIITGVHSPSIPLNMPWTETRTKTITKIKTKTVSIPSLPTKEHKEEEPPHKKQKLSAWRTGHNKPIDETNTRNNRNSNTSTQNEIPAGLETLYDESGKLVPELSDLDPKLVSTIGHELLQQYDHFSWNDIAGLEAQKKRIQEVVIWPLLKPELFTNDSLLEPAKGALLFGPPGTGKTMIAKAIAAESSANFFSISSSSLQSKWIGESSKLVKTMFSVARYMAPSIVFMDEVDSLLSKRSHNSNSGSSSMNTLKTQFLMEFQGVKSSKHDGFVLIIGATNFPEAIDDAARRRFSRRLYIPLPDDKGRSQLMKNLLKKSERSMGHCLSDEDVEYLVQKTKGYSGSDITDVAKEAALGPLREAASVDFRSVTKEKMRKLRLDDFEQALKQSKATVTEEQIKKYEEWNDKFGAKK